MTEVANKKSTATAEIQQCHPLASIHRRWAKIVLPAIIPTLCKPPRAYRLSSCDGEQLWFPLGSINRVVQCLARHSTGVRFTMGPACPPEEHPDLFVWPAYSQPAKLDRVLRDNTRGQLLVDGRPDMVKLAARITDSLPGANILVIAPSESDALDLAPRMAQVSLRPIQTEPDFSAQPRMLITHPAVYETCLAESADWHVALFAEPQALILSDDCYLGYWAPAPRQYCIVPRDEVLKDNERLRLEHHCGPPIYQLLDPAHDMAEVIVLQTAFPATAKRRAKTSATKAERARSATDNERTSQVAQLARALFYGDIAQISRGLGGPLADQHMELLLAGKGSTAILVEQPQQLSALAKLLPSWLRLDLSTPITAHSWDGQIASAAYAEQHGLRARDVIRADDGATWPLTTGYPPLRHQIGADQALLIDICDSGHAHDEENAASRRAAYERLGWTMLAQP